MTMNRRHFFRTTAGALVAPAVPCASQILARADEKSASLPRPSKAQLVWQDCEVGLIYHFDLPIAAGRFAPNNMVRERLDPNLYHPTRLDTDQWIEAAKAAGARYAVFTATHFNGFMQWQSDLYPYSLKYTHWRNGKADVVADFVDSCRRAGIRPGLYLSTHRNVYWTVWGHYVDWGKGRGSAKQAVFNRIAEKMVEELCSRYGPLVQIWFDAGVKTPDEGGPDVLPIFEKHQPQSVFYHNRQRSDHRWIGNEQGYAGYPCWATMPGRPGEVSHNYRGWRSVLGTGDPTGTYWSPGMVDVPLRGARGVHNWFWKPRQDHAAHSLHTLVKMYYQSVGRNCNFIIGEVVNQDGEVPQSDIDRLAEFGREIRRRFSRPVAEAAGVGRTVELELPRPRRIDHVVIMEEIAHGERIRRYRIDGLVSGNRWQRLTEGQSVGHKRIERFAPVEVARVRLTVLQSIAPPRIRSLAAYAADG